MCDTHMCCGERQKWRKSGLNSIGCELYELKLEIDKSKTTKMKSISVV